MHPASTKERETTAEMWREAERRQFAAVLERKLREAR
jgi:hypothetical protein